MMFVINHLPRRETLYQVKYLILNYLQENYKEQLTIQDLITKMGYSPAEFERILGGPGT